MTNHNLGKCESVKLTLAIMKPIPLLPPVTTATYPLTPNKLSVIREDILTGSKEMYDGYSGKEFTQYVTTPQRTNRLSRKALFVGRADGQLKKDSTLGWVNTMALVLKSMSPP